MALPPDAEYDDAVPLPSDEETPVKAIRKTSKSFNQAYMFGAYGFNASYSRGTSDTKTDYMDLNGDRYPDIVGTYYVQYRSQWGGLGDLEVITRGLRDSTTSVSNCVGTGFGASPFRHSRVIANSPDKGKYTLDADGSVSGSFNFGWDRAPGMWSDINGDGLPDYVYEDGTVMLNNGYAFLGAEDWDLDGVRSGQSVSSSASTGGSAAVGGGLGSLLNNKVNIEQGSIQAGHSLGRSANRTGRTLMDINGDGLPDQVWRNVIDIDIDDWDDILHPVDSVHV